MVGKLLYAAISLSPPAKRPCSKPCEEVQPMQIQHLVWHSYVVHFVDAAHPRWYATMLLNWAKCHYLSCPLPHMICLVASTVLRLNEKWWFYHWFPVTAKIRAGCTYWLVANKIAFAEASPSSDGPAPQYCLVSASSVSPHHC